MDGSADYRNELRKFQFNFSDMFVACLAILDLRFGRVLRFMRVPACVCMSRLAERLGNFVSVKIS